MSKLREGEWTYGRIGHGADRYYIIEAKIVGMEGTVRRVGFADLLRDAKSICRLHNESLKAKR